MSLINEALKRTRDASFPGGGSVRMDAPQYRMGEDRSRRFFGIWHLSVAGAIILTLILAAHTFVNRRTRPVTEALVGAGATAEAVAETTARGATTPDAELAAKTAKVFAVKSPEEVAAVSLTASEPSAVVAPPAPAAAPAPAPVPPATPIPPALKLQGIMRDGQSFEAMINGYNYRVGESVEGCQVVAIDDRGVQLDFEGQKLALRLR